MQNRSARTIPPCEQFALARVSIRALGMIACDHHLERLPEEVWQNPWNPFGRSRINTKGTLMDESDEGGSGITRAELLKAAAVVAPGLLLGRTEAAAATAKPAPSRRLGRTRGLGGMNVLLFLTDQQRAIQHFPRDWGRRNMPGLTRLQEHGMLFEHAFTNACMCSPARSTLMSGYFPAQHGVKYTLETDMPAPQYPQVELSTNFKNLASVSQAAGYTPVYKGKFHCNKPANGSEWVPEDVNKYGFTRWDPPDAGADQSIPEEGGGSYDNDGRFMNSEGTPEAGTEGAVQYLRDTAAKS